jgi:hypothetical protein
MKNTARSAIAAAAFAAIGMAFLTNLAHTTPLSDCYDNVIKACNKLPDHAVNSCVNNGLDQCDGQFTSKGGSSSAEISKLRASAAKKLKTSTTRK